MAYSGADAHHARSELDMAQTHIGELVSAISEDSSILANAMVNILQRLQTDLGEHFERSPLSKPAAIRLLTSSRRHPLHVADLNLSIPVELLNESEGAALDLQVELIDAIGLRPSSDPVRLSSMNPGSIVVEFDAQTDPAALEDLDSAICSFRLSWTNADGTLDDTDVTAELMSQDARIDWDALSLDNPYSLEAVENENEFVGRARLLDRMTRVLATKSVGSLYVHGQKRVGKTSLAHVALKRIARQRDVRYVYLETGEINNRNASIAVDNLVRELISRLAAWSLDSSSNSDIVLDGSLRPLISRLKSIADPDNPIIIAIDEFDRLPAPLYGHTDEGDAFFTGLRSIANIRGIGLVLIGGERMKLIINGPGVELNRFNAFPIDYLDRSTQWGEFQELVRRPTEAYLEFTDEACAKIYDMTSGNPFYAKQLCGKILDLAAERRDAYIDVRDVDLAIAKLLSEIDSASFSHYWEDHVLEYGEKRDQITVVRRRCLLALGLAWSSGRPVTGEVAVREAAQFGLSQPMMERELRLFKDRGFLVENDGALLPRVELFGRWLQERGPSEIIVSAGEFAEFSSIIEARAVGQVTVQEAEVLARKLGPYRGKGILGQNILEYLRQFGGHYNQRLIFKYLESIYFVTQADEDALLREAYRSLTAKLGERYETWQQSQLALSYAGGPGKSSAATVRAFLKANGDRFIRSEVYEPSELVNRLDRGGTDVVVLDDFIGTGDTLKRELKELHVRIPESMNLHVVALVAMNAGLEAVKRLAR